MCVNIITDKHWFKENILCLLSNAVKYSNGGIVTVTVSQVYARMPQSQSEIKLDNESSASPAISALGYRDSSPNYDSMIVFSIEDGGIGISEKERAELFQPFKQAQRLAGGTGELSVIFHLDRRLWPVTIYRIMEVVVAVTIIIVLIV